MALDRLYGFTREKANEKPPPPQPLPAGASWADELKYKNAVEAHKKWKDPRPMLQAGADRNMFREATCDGMRLIACLAKYVEPGEDPVKVLIRMMADVGLDVDCADLAWANDEDETVSGEIEAAE